MTARAAPRKAHRPKRALKANRCEPVSSLLVMSEQICSMITSINPFRYSEPVPVEELIDRDPEAEALMARAEEGNNSRLVAPRRFGKTSLLRRLMSDADRAGWATVYVDFFGVLTLADIAQRIERSYAEQLQGRLATWFAGARRRLRPAFRAAAGRCRGVST